MLKGDLSSFGLGEIFQSLAINNHTGTLKITSPDHEEKLIYFVQGEIRRFSHGTSEELRIGEVLVRLGKITIDDLDEAYENEKKTHTSFGIALLKKGLVTKDDIVQALRIKIQEEIYSLFLWTAGHFEFDMNSSKEDLFDELQKSASVAINTNSVIMEGLRRVDEWKFIHTKIATFDEIFVRTDVEPDEIEELDATFLEKIDGVRPVVELFREYYGTRFELCKLLFDFLESGYVRFVNAEECLQGAAHHRRRKQFTIVTHFLRFATQLKPGDPDLHSQLGESLTASYQEEGARDALARAAELYYEQGNLKAIAAVGEKLIPSLHHLKPHDLQVLFNSYLQLEDAKKAVLIGNQLASFLQKEGDFDKAAEVLGAVVELNPNDLNLLIEIGTLFQKAEDFERATTYFESVAESLKKVKKYRELLKILRLLQNLHPKSVELKQRLSATQALIERLEQQKKRRITIAGIALIVLVVISLVPIMYEIKAREFFNSAQRHEQISMVSLDFSKAKQAYEELLKNYSFSSKVAEAEVALERISRLEKERLRSLKTDAQVDSQNVQRERGKRREELIAELTKARTAEESGDTKTASKLYLEILKNFKDIPESREILLPLLITANPKNTQVDIFIDGKDEVDNAINKVTGTTPYIHHYSPGSTLNLQLSLSGCETIRKEIALKDQYEMHFELKRKPVGEFQPTVGTQQTILTARGRLLFPSRDGHLYALDSRKGAVQWKRPVGRFGDRVSDISTRHDEIYISTITGEVTAISVLNGKSRWVTKVSEPVYGAPSISPKGDWLAVGTLAGNVHLIDNRNGKVVDQFSTDNRIVASPVIVGDWLIVSSTDNSIHFYSVSRKKAEFTVGLGSDITLTPTLAGDSLYVCTDNGFVHRVDIKSRRVPWSLNLKQRPTTSVLLTDAGAHVGTATGRLVTFDPKTGEKSHERVLGQRPVVGGTIHGETLYVTLASGELIALDPVSNVTVWSYQTGVPILTSPLVVDGRLYVNNANGRFLVFEILE